MAKNDGRTGWQAVKAGLELADCLFEGQIHIHIYGIHWLRNPSLKRRYSKVNEVTR